MTTRVRWILAFSISAVVIVAVTLAGRPTWQIHDDTYYAMLADGYGLVTKPVVEIPYMHPLIGRAVAGIRHSGGQFGYATLLYLCLWLGGVAITYRFIASCNLRVTTLCLIAGMAPLALLPQYTAVAGFLVASTAVLWTVGKDGPPSSWALVFGLVLVFLASLFRIEMVALATVCLAPVVLADAYYSGWLTRSLARKVALGAAVLLVGHYAADISTGNPRMDEFYRLNDSVAEVTNYGYGAAIAHAGVDGDTGFTANDLSLLNSWFFAYSPLVEPATVTALVDHATWREVLRQRYLEALRYTKALPSTAFFWLVLASFVLAFMSRRRYSVLGAIALFSLASIVITLVGKPPPERVSLGIAIGLFMLASLTQRGNVGTSRRRLWTNALAASLLLPIGWNIVTDRLDMAQEARQLEIDFPLLQGSDVLYVWAGAFPLRAGFRPFHALANVPPIVFMGSMYLLPEVGDGERARGCGGFVQCLVSGSTLKLLASDDQVQLLDTLLREHFGKTLMILDRTETPSFTLQLISARDG